MELTNYCNAACPQCDRYEQIQEWQDPDLNNSHFTLEQIKNISILLNPIIPVSTKKVLDTINLSDKDISIENIKKHDIVDYNLELKNLDILFKKIENDN